MPGSAAASEGGCSTGLSFLRVAAVAVPAAAVADPHLSAGAEIQFSALYTHTRRPKDVGGCPSAGRVDAIELSIALARVSVAPLFSCTRGLFSLFPAQMASTDCDDMVDIITAADRLGVPDLVECAAAAAISPLSETHVVALANLCQVGISGRARCRPLLLFTCATTSRRCGGEPKGQQDMC